MLTFDFRDWEIKASVIEGVARKVPTLAANALNGALFDARNEEMDLMQSVFDRPTRYTLRSMYVKKATPNSLTAELQFKDAPNSSRAAWKWLGPQVHGGSRKHKAFEKALIGAGIMQPGEFAVPSKRLKLDGNGNIPTGTLARILSQLGAAERMAGYRANMTERSKRGAIKRAGGQYIVIRDGGTPAAGAAYGARGNAPPGIYLKKDKWAVPAILFVHGVSYKKRFPYYEKAKEVVPKGFRWRFQRGLRTYFETGSTRRAA